MGKEKKANNRKQWRWPDHDHELVHTFGVEDYDAYWNAAPIRKGLRPILKRMARELQTLIPTPAKLLELGPGPGELFNHLVKAGYEMYACDASQVSLDRIQAPPGRLKLANLNAGLPDFGTKFNAILFALVLHHINKPDVFLGQLRDALVPGGYLALTIPNIITLRNRMRMMAGKFPELSPSHRNFMTPTEVKELMRRCNLKVKRVLSARRKPLQTISPTLFSKELILIAQVG